MAIARYGEIKDPAKIAAVLSEWDIVAKNKLSQVYEEAQVLLKDSNFMKGKSLKERRESAFKSILENKKIRDSKKRDEMCLCAGACEGGSVVSNLDFKAFKLEPAIVCAKNDLMTWFIQR